MARRYGKAERHLIDWLLFTGILLYGIPKLMDLIDMELVIGLLEVTAIVVVIIISVKVIQKNCRKKALIAKYDDESIVKMLMSHTWWQGQTAEQLKDSLGTPKDVDQKVLKTKKKEIWKYKHQGSNRYGLRIILENDIVVGWDHKD